MVGDDGRRAAGGEEVEREAVANRSKRERKDNQRAHRQPRCACCKER